MSSQSYYTIQEAYLDIYENVGTGKSKRASFGGIAQKPSAQEIKDIRAAARRKPEPLPVDKPRQKRKGIGILPSGGVESTAKLLRGGNRRQPLQLAKRRLTTLKQKSRNPSMPTPELLKLYGRMGRMEKAISKSKKWGTPQAAAEEVILGYLLDEGYADCLGSAEIILENMSDEWVDTILEAKWGVQPLPVDKMKKKEAYYADPKRVFKRWQDLYKPDNIRKVRERMSR